MAQRIREGLEVTPQPIVVGVVGAVEDGSVVGAAAAVLLPIQVEAGVEAVRPAIRPMAAQPAKPRAALSFTRPVMDRSPETGTILREIMRTMPEKEVLPELTVTLGE